MTQMAYDCVRQDNLSEWSYQKYWYSGVVPIRRYCKEQEIEVYSPESIRNCVKWFQGQLELGFVKDAKFQKVRKIAQIMETFYNGESLKQIGIRYPPKKSITTAPPKCGRLNFI